MYLKQVVFNFRITFRRDILLCTMYASFPVVKDNELVSEGCCTLNYTLILLHSFVFLMVSLEKLIIDFNDHFLDTCFFTN